MIHPDTLRSLPFRDITRQQVADLLGIKYASVGNLCIKGKIGIDGNRHYLIPKKGKYPLNEFIHFYNNIHHAIPQQQQPQRLPTRQTS